MLRAVQRLNVAAKIQLEPLPRRSSKPKPTPQADLIQASQKPRSGGIFSE
jgi:hypothetical protein